MGRPVRTTFYVAEVLTGAILQFYLTISQQLKTILFACANIP